MRDSHIVGIWEEYGSEDVSTTGVDFSGKVEMKEDIRAWRSSGRVVKMWRTGRRVVLYHSH